ncbi:MAG TPA: MFS transporter [Casimicrobiaceae bacterium]|nr:MFS transporter [Casimicrobiaceae bacterium]
MNPPAESDAGELLGHRPFVLFWFTRVCTIIGYQMLTVAVGWQVYALTGSAFDLGLVGLVQFLPALLLLLLAGHVADRYDRRRIAGACQGIEAALALLLAAGSARGWITEHAIFALVFALGAVRAFETPSLQALLPALVPAVLLPRAVAASSTAVQTAIIVGPAVGGLLYIAGPAWAYAVCAVMFAAASLLTRFIHHERVPPPHEPATLRSVFAGLSFIRSRQAIMGAITLDMVAVLLGGVTALLPIFAKDILHTGPLGLGLLRSAPAVGALAVAFYLSRHPLQRHAGRTMFLAVGVFGAMTIVFGLSRWFPLSLAALVLLGASDMISVVVRSSLIQLGTPDAMRGRVSAVNAMFIGTSNQLGEFESGVTAAWLGTVPAVVLGGIGTLLAVMLGMRLFPQLARIDRLESARHV